MTEALKAEQARIIIVLTCSDPPETIADRPKGRAFYHLGWEQLRFNRSESEALVQGLSGRKLPPECIDRIHRKCAGWALGMVMLLKSAMEENRDIRIRPDFIPEVIWDYFQSEIISPLPLPMQSFLMDLALLPQIDATITASLEKYDHSPQARFEGIHSPFAGWCWNHTARYPAAPPVIRNLPSIFRHK